MLILVQSENMTQVDLLKFYLSLTPKMTLSRFLLMMQLQKNTRQVPRHTISQTTPTQRDIQEFSSQDITPQAKLRLTILRFQETSPVQVAKAETEVEAVI